SAARTYRPEPPTRIGGEPSARSRSINGRTSRWYSATLAVRVTSQTSSRWCGTPRISSRVSLAVPMSMPAYSCMESAFTTSPPSRSASSTARSDFPAAVGPTTAITGTSPTFPVWGLPAPVRAVFLPTGGPCRARSHLPVEGRLQIPLQGQQPPLGLHARAAAEAAQSVARHHPLARHHDRSRPQPRARHDGPRRDPAPAHLGQLAVGDRLAVRHPRVQRAQHPPLRPGRQPPVDRDLERLRLTREVRRQLRQDARRAPRIVRLRQPEALAHPRPRLRAVPEPGRGESPLGHGDHHRAQRRLHSAEGDRLHHGFRVPSRNGASGPVLSYARLAGGKRTTIRTGLPAVRARPDAKREQ